MEYRILGNTGLKVSELCFGALTIGPLQANLSVEDGGRLIKQALDRGVNFINTAEQYQTYDYIKHALKGFRGDAVIATKSLAVDYNGMKRSIENALRSLDREVIDIFHLHAARASVDVFDKRSEALRCLVDYKEKGYIRATGISTHNVKVVERAAKIPEIDVVYPLINKLGKGILDGSLADMLAAIETCRKAGKGLYAMKVLAGGYLINDLLDAIAFARGIESMHSVSVGMANERELELNLKIFSGEDVAPEMLPGMSAKKLLIVDIFCKRCGACMDVCPNSALSMGEKSVVVNPEKCLLCGYCHPVCPELAIRII
ncbi:MAG: aldo/keto reductase [Bacillota bacterium]